MPEEYTPKPTYFSRVELANGHVYTFESEEEARSQSAWQRIAACENGAPFPTLDAQQWEKVLRALEKILEREDV